MRALIVIDMLKDFIEEGAVLEVPMGRKIIDNVKKLIKCARERKMPVIYVCDAHLMNDGEFEYWPPHAIKGTRGAEVIDELKPTEGDVIVEKRRYSGFYGTSLDLLLRENGVKELIMTGVLTNVCVFFTAADAFMRGYKVIVVSDGTAALSKKDHEWALEQARAVLKAEVVSTREVIERYFP